MKFLLTIVVAAVAAFAARGLTRTSGTRAGNEDGAPRAHEAALSELRAENARLAAELERRSDPLVAGPGLAGAGGAGEIGEAEIAAALARWEAAHPPAERAAAEAARAAVAPGVAGEPDLASVPIGELVRALSSEGFSSLERQELFQKLRENGRIDEYVAAIEELARANPDDVDLQVALGHAYLQKLFGVANSPEAGPLAFKSDAAFTRALELDENNWSARFAKAVSLSNWPAFLGRGPEAIEHFEILIEQQSTLPERNEFAMPYLFLGNMHQASGATDKALAAWRAGLERFPDFEDLQAAIALLESQTQAPDGSRPQD
jgi:tetratricopeptide (TPR) repeat protein